MGKKLNTQQEQAALSAPKGFSVGEVAARTGVTVQTLHFYEKKGLIASSRNTGNQRRYNGSVLRRVAIIKAAQKIGIPLKEIAEVFSELPLFDSPTTSQWKVMSTHWRRRLQQRIEGLTLLRDQLDSCIGCGCLSIKSCGLRNPGDEASQKGAGAVFWK